MTGLLYFPLDQGLRQIRLLVLLPGLPGSGIEIRLEPASFSANNLPQYEALSYEWGSSTHRKEIFANGHPIEVRENLWNALDALRFKEDSRVLWIDAICINQTDVSERNHQVQQMTDIYSQASCVLAWLGTVTPQSRVAMAHLRKLNALLHKPNPSVSKMARSPQKWDAVLSLFQNSYWNRVWIVQEIGLAKEIQVIFGEDQISWDAIQGLVLWLDSTNLSIFPKAAKFVKKSLPAMLQKHRIAHKNGSCTLLGLLQDCADSLCTVPHDKIYGFLGLANDYNREDFLIDYEKSTLELHAEVVSFQLKKIQAEELNAGWAPSWVTKLQSDLFTFGQLVSELLGCSFGTDIESFNFAQSQPWVARVTDHFLEVNINHGLAKINAVRQPLEDESSWRDKVLRMPAMTKSWYLHKHFDKMFLSPTVRHVLHINTPRSRVLLARDERKIPETFAPSERVEDEATLHSAHYVQGVNFWSESGYMGIVPRGTTVGDYLYQIGNTEFVLVIHPDGRTNPIIGCAVTTALVAKTVKITYGRSQYIPTFMKGSESAFVPPPAVFRFVLPTFQLLQTVKPSRTIKQVD